MIVNSAPDSGNANNVRIVNTAGQLNSSSANYASGGVLDC